MKCFLSITWTVMLSASLNLKPHIGILPAIDDIHLSKADVTTKNIFSLILEQLLSRLFQQKKQNNFVIIIEKTLFMTVFMHSNRHHKYTVEGARDLLFTPNHLDDLMFYTCLNK